MKILRLFLGITFIGSIILMAFLLLMDFGVLPIRGTEFSRGISHVSALLLMFSSAYQLLRDKEGN